MIRVALIGSDSTHTEAFAKRLNGGETKSRARAVSICGTDPEQTKSKAAALGIDRVARTPAEALENVDLAMVIGRFADSHFEPTKMALELGIPTFVDKPFVPTHDEAKALAALSRSKGVPLCSSSPLRFAREVKSLKALLAEQGDWSCVASLAPASCTDLGPDPRLDSAFFYGIHGLEILVEVAGHESANTETMFSAGVIDVSLEPMPHKTALFQLIRNAPEFYRLDAYFPDACKTWEVQLDGSYYSDQLDFLLDRFLAGKETIPLESTVKVIELLERIDNNDPIRKAKRQN